MPTETDFVPADLNCQDWESIKPLVESLLTRSIESAQALERWLLERSDLESFIMETRSHLHVDMTCDTDDEAKSKAYQHFNESVMPHVQKAGFRLDRKYYDCPHRAELDRDRYDVLDRGVAADIEIFREENVTIQTELSRLRQEHSKITGAQSVEFEGKTRTLPEMSKYQEDTNRETRKAAWLAVADRQMADRQALRELFDGMFTRRHQMALNADLANFMEYSFKSFHRFDYGPEECRAFHDAIEKHVVPLYRALGTQRAESLGVTDYRPWDARVDVHGRGALDPFDCNVDRMVDGARTVLSAMDPELATGFETLTDGTSLDLDTRAGKAPGGYQTVFAVERKPFIFMNSLGLGRDFRVLLHEAGHAFHTLLGGNDPLLPYRHAPIEFCEVASMTMELTSLPYMGLVYTDNSEADRSRRVQLEGIIRLLPWIAQIDAFQHWLYTHPDHSHAEREAAWLSLDARFGAGFDWTGIEQYRTEAWQGQLHLYLYPFYYVEYGIAQLGALQVWINSLEDEQGALAAYKKALSLGGSRPLPDLFDAAGATFRFDSETVSGLMERLGSELSRLPM
ncbi:MAG: M3 family oligoendopeptidase [Planctomycetes bacterium]|nr:M3 family oligoendopeptidase [Planctomycetota bacterium]